MLRNKTVVKILSLLIAIVLWAYVMGEVTPTSSATLKDLKVNIVNEDVLEEAGLAVAGDTEYKVTVVLEGKRSVVKKVKKDDLDVTADVQGYKRGTHYVDVKVEAPDDVKVVDIKDSKIKIKVEEKVSVKKKVSIVLTGNSEGAELKDEEAAPDTVTVSGAASDVEKVRSVNAPVSAKALEKGKGEADAELIAVDGSGDQVKAVSLSTEKARIQASVMRTKTVPLKVKIKGEGKKKVSIDAPEKIKIQGTKTDLADINKISTESIDVSGLKGTAAFQLTLDVPKGIKVLTPSAKLIATITVE
ncbi:MAG: hypothetical protein IKS63_05100 [Firmicutes bacterium]|nr:hypothetical protein [Bacillota bacterium]